MAVTNPKTVGPMTVGQLRTFLNDYADEAMVQICVSSVDSQTENATYYTVGKVSPLVGSSPEQPVLDIGEFIAG